LTILFPIIFSWSALYIGIKFWLEWGLQKNKVDQANTIATETRLQMLRYQLNPHFLFNALNSIRATIGDNDNKARSMITELSEFLRYSLLSNDHQEIPFKDEITTVKHYLSIEKKRFEEKLDIKFEIDPNVENFPILSFLIHPIIENAIKYGMKTSKIPLKILIKADELKNGLCINIINSGYWIKPTQKDRDSAQGTGTGLENVTARLKWGFPDRHKFEYFERDGNVVVIMELYKNLETSS
jgi:LytS/YehU family sensor histidine kinase